MLITPSTAIVHAAHSIASVSICRLKRSMPYIPVFSRIPARMTEIGVGASTCASGNQVWNGNIGTLMEKPMKRATKTAWRRPSPGRARPANTPDAPFREVQDVEGVRGARAVHQLGRPEW